MLDPSARYDIKAEAFRIMTGHMAPGKDVSPCGYAEPYEARCAAFEKWLEAHGATVNAMIHAAERVLDL